MHLRGDAFVLTDTLHIVWTGIVVPLMMRQIAFGAAALGRCFRLYSVLTIVTMILFGTLTGIEAPNILADGPTTWIGIVERVGMAAHALWIIVLALVLLRTANGSEDQIRR